MIPNDCQPSDAKETVMEYLEGPDRSGNYHFALYWLTDYIPGHPKPDPVRIGGKTFFVRGQHFCANPKYYVERTLDTGGWVRDVDRRKGRKASNETSEQAKKRADAARVKMNEWKEDPVLVGSG